MGPAAHQSCFGPTWPSKAFSEPGYLGPSNLCLQKGGRKRQREESIRRASQLSRPPETEGGPGNPVGALTNCPGVCSPMWDRDSWPSPSPPSRNCPYLCSLPAPSPSCFVLGPPASLPPSHPGLCLPGRVTTQMPLPLLDLEGGVHLVEPRPEAALGGCGAGILPAGAGRGGCRERVERVQ